MMKELLLASGVLSSPTEVVEACLRSFGFFTSPSGQTAVLKREMWDSSLTLSQRIILSCGALGLDVARLAPLDAAKEPGEDDADPLLDALHTAASKRGGLGELAFTVEARDTLAPAVEKALQAGDFPTPAPAAQWMIFHMLHEHEKLKKMHGHHEARTGATE